MSRGIIEKQAKDYEAPGFKTLDLRKVPEWERSIRVLQAFESIKPADEICIVSDRSLQPLLRQFQGELSGRFEWKVVKDGPDCWQVLILKKNGFPGERICD